MRGAAGVATLAATPVLAQTAAWPSRLLKIIVPLPPGGVMDGLTRVVADRLAPRLGQSVIVENKPGANGMIAASAVAGADPDGYTILSTMSSIVQNVSLHKSPSYKMSDLLPLAPLGRLPIAFIVPKTLGVTTLREFVEKARTSAKPLSYGTYGLGSSAHIIGEVLMKNTGIKLLQVPYRGEAPALTAILAGEVDSAFVSVGGAVAQAENARALAIANPARMKRYADIPTFDEAGFPVLGLTGFSGFFAPAAVPKPVADRLARELRAIVALPDVNSRLLDLGFEDMSDIADFAGFVDDEVKRWASVIHEFNISI
ncbi:tripartite tricarboxylate transporter substrate binding protein [Bradyrhizobium sp. 147]|uniref:Bug family tripartite tricarboxylate transporter substrate binding protein n=1 Tax=Bradyrhizobium sp. 147 TaxID=2782623 RepID=UPI001FFC138E|nr:tripartite tricarboxylate transporter substrate binding protein [Bradyrhizobium sp. 147]MCK1678855.1 tripartite tricarboxylate transporter substrate binding protein [Bradyrhizobium sp. 147]